jgi:hypothetical protein
MHIMELLGTVQVEVVLRLEYAPNFFPSSVTDIINAYDDKNHELGFEKIRFVTMLMIQRDKVQAVRHLFYTIQALRLAINRSSAPLDWHNTCLAYLIDVFTDLMNDPVLARARGNLTANDPVIQQLYNVVYTPAANTGCGEEEYLSPLRSLVTAMIKQDSKKATHVIMTILFCLGLDHTAFTQVLPSEADLNDARNYLIGQLIEILDGANVYRPRPRTRRGRSLSLPSATHMESLRLPDQRPTTQPTYRIPYLVTKTALMALVIAIACISKNV